MKIADFGYTFILRVILYLLYFIRLKFPLRLSRDIYVDNIYMKSSAGRLPIKWLALESMTDQKYTSQSDVYVTKKDEEFYTDLKFRTFFHNLCHRWSFGILLYEIVTMGSTPYPTVPVDCLISYLKSGNRMSKPFNCSQDLYDEERFLRSFESWNTKRLIFSVMTLCIRVGTMNPKNDQHSPKYYKNSIHSFSIQVSMESYRSSM